MKKRPLIALIVLVILASGTYFASAWREKIRHTKVIGVARYYVDSYLQSDPAMEKAVRSPTERRWPIVSGHAFTPPEWVYAGYGKGNLVALVGTTQYEEGRVFITAYISGSKSDWQIDYLELSSCQGATNYPVIGLDFHAADCRVLAQPLGVTGMRLPEYRSLKPKDIHNYSADGLAAGEELLKASFSFAYARDPNAFFLPGSDLDDNDR